MSLLISLLAFATIMILMSTLVMMIVNGINGFVRLRSRTLERSMRLLYEDVIEPMLPREARTQTSRQFARSLVLNPSLQRSQGLFQRTMFGPRKFDRLSPNDFIEQFPQTEAGQILAHHAGAQLPRRLEEILYNFERYSSAGNDYFIRRAKLISVAVAILLAFVFNIDAFRLFSGLVQNQQLSAMIAQSNDPIDEGELADMLRELQASGLAIGPSQYPFCITPPGAPEPSGDGVPALMADARCEGSEPAEDRFDSYNSMVAPIASGFQQFIVERVTDEDWLIMLVWAISVLAAGGLIGMGAPFWANAYGQIASLVPAMKVIAPLVSDPSRKRRADPAGDALQTQADKTDERVRRTDDVEVKSRKEMMEKFSVSLAASQSRVRISADQPGQPMLPSRRLV